MVPDIYVFESVPRLAIELHREFRGTGIRLREFRKLAVLREAVAGVAAITNRAGIVALDFCADPSGTLVALPVLHHVHSQAIFLVVLDDLAAAWEWPLRELGVTQVFTGPRSAAELARFCRRQLPRDFDPLESLTEELLAFSAPVSPTTVTN